MSFVCGWFWLDSVLGFWRMDVCFCFWLLFVFGFRFGFLAYEVCLLFCGWRAVVRFIVGCLLVFVVGLLLLSLLLCVWAVCAWAVCGCLLELI